MSRSSRVGHGLCSGDHVLRYHLFRRTYDEEAHGYISGARGVRKLSKQARLPKVPMLVSKCRVDNQ